MPAIPEVRARAAAAAGGRLRAGTRRRCAPLALLLAGARGVRRSLVPRAEALPRLAAEADGLAELPEPVARIERAIDEDGAVRDDATPELARLRREIHGARGRIVAAAHRLRRLAAVALPGARRLGEHPRGPLRHPGAAGGARGGGGHRARRVGQRGDALHRAAGRHRDDEPAARAGGGGGSARSSASSASSPTLLRPDAEAIEISLRDPRAAGLSAGARALRAARWAATSPRCCPPARRSTRWSTAATPSCWRVRRPSSPSTCAWSRASAPSSSPARTPGARRCC